MSKVKKSKVGTAPAHDQSSRTVNGFVADNADKWERALHGTIGAEGRLQGGVGDGASPEAKLAEYDRLGGLIRFEGRKVKTGAFWDFEAGKAVAEPKPVWVVTVEGEQVEVPVGEELPVEAKAAEIAQTRKAAKNAEPKGRTSVAKKAKPAIEDEE